MRALNTRYGMSLAAVAAVSALVLTSCSSDPEVAETPSASAVASDEALPATASAAPVVTGAVAAACAAYFDLDLLNSTYAGGAVADGDITEEQAREQFRAGLKELVAEAKLAVEDGSGDEKLLANAKRMRKNVNSLDKGEPLSALSEKRQTRIANSSLRVQRACARAGLPLPEDNVIARTAAGL